MKKGRKRAIRHVQQLGLPEDVVLGLPRLVLSGDTSLMLENHQGVVAYGDTVIRLRTACGILTVEGESMTLAQMGKHDLMLRGTIRAIRYDQ